MNKTFRLIWSSIREAWIVVAEKVSARGGIPARTVTPPGLPLSGEGINWWSLKGFPPDKGGQRGVVLAAVALLALSGQAHALPQGGQVVGGNSAIGSPANGQMVINQNSPKSIINWQSYGIAAGEKMQYIQPSSSAISLNRVTGVDPTVIHGQLSANGKVWVINPNGLLIGNGARIDVGGFLGSTLNIGNEDFMNGSYRFRADRATPGSISNLGDITTTDGGYVMLIAPTVSNQGAITTNQGKSYLVSGDEVTLSFAGNDLIGFTVDKGVVNGETAGISNSGRISAHGGEVIFSARAANDLLKSVVNNTGVIEARTVENRSGRIFLLGDMDRGTVQVGGTLDASAPSGGNGGFIETSAAHVKIADDAKITTAAANGLAGSWLIDPVDFTIASGGGALTASGIGATTLSNNLGLGNVSIATDGSTGGNGDIFVNSAVSWSANKLTLSAHRNIAINANLNGSGTASLALEYGQASAGGGGSSYSLSGGAKVTLPAGLNFSTKLGTGGVTTDHTVITTLGAAGSVTGADLQGMGGNLAGNYVLGADIDACLTGGNCASGATPAWNAGAGFVPVGDSATKFTGSFDGLGHTITGLTINTPGWNVPANSYQGLFGYSTGSLSNIGLLNSSISGANVVGALAGRSDGAVSYAYADGGSVTASVHQAGGLVGGLGGTGSISNSYANVSVTGTDYACCGGGVSSTGIGGLAGMGAAGFSISNSYATGSVSGGTDVGGLVGQAKAGTISNSYATGAVSGGTFVGGLSGSDGSGAQAVVVTNSYWDTQTSGRATSYGGTGKTTAQMKQLATFAAWDIDAVGGTGKVWRIYEGNTNPLLRHYLTALTVTANNATTTYSGAAYSGGNGVSYSTAPNANLLGTVSYGGTSQGAVNVGSYTVTPSGLYSNQKGYDIAYANGALTIDPVPLSLLSVTANNIGKTYGAAYTFNGTEFNPVGLQGGDTIGSVTLTSAGAPASASVGSYTIVPSNATGGTFNPANYIITYVNGTLTVTPASLAVTANNALKTYDGLTWSGSNGVSYSGFVNGEDATVLGGSLSYGGSSQGAKNAGSYSITPSGLTSGNYSISFNNGTLTINKANATVIANSGTTTYTGQTQGVSGFTASGLVGGETASVLTGITTSGGTGTNAGTYPHTIGGTNGNYNLTFVDGSLVITPAPLAVTAHDASKTYDGLTYSGGYGVSYSGFVNNETAAVLGGSLSYGGSSQGAKNASSYVITPSGLTSGNYTISYSNGTLSISPAQLKVVADAQAKLYGNPDPELTYGAIGLQAGDTAASVLSGNLTREPGEVLGSYAIEQGSLVSNANYLLSYSGNALTIGPNQSYEEARAAGFQTKSLVANAPANLMAGQLFTVDYDSFKVWQSAALPLSEK